MMEIMDQPGGRHTQGPARIETRQPSEIHRAEHHFEEMLAVVIATRYACADAAINISGDRATRQDQRIGFGQPDAARDKAVGVFQPVASLTQLGKTLHQLGANLWRGKSVHNCKGRPGEYWCLRVLASAKSDPKNMAISG